MCCAGSSSPPAAVAGSAGTLPRSASATVFPDRPAPWATTERSDLSAFPTTETGTASARSVVIPTAQRRERRLCRGPSSDSRPRSLATLVRFTGTFGVNCLSSRGQVHQRTWSTALRVATAAPSEACRRARRCFGADVGSAAIRQRGHYRPAGWPLLDAHGQTAIMTARSPAVNHVSPKVSIERASIHATRHCVELSWAGPFSTSSGSANRCVTP